MNKNAEPSTDLEAMVPIIVAWLDEGFGSGNLDARDLATRLATLRDARESVGGITEERLASMKVAAVFPDGRPDRTGYAAGWNEALDEVAALGAESGPAVSHEASTTGQANSGGGAESVPTRTLYGALFDGDSALPGDRDVQIERVYRTFRDTLIAGGGTGTLGRARTRRAAIGLVEAIAHLRRVIDERPPDAGLRVGAESVGGLEAAKASVGTTLSAVGSVLAWWETNDWTTERRNADPNLPPLIERLRDAQRMASEAALALYPQPDALALGSEPK